MTDIEIFRGDSEGYTLIFKDEDGDAIDISGSKVFFTVKRNSKDPDSNAIISKTISSHTDPVNGRTEFSLSATETSVTPGIYYYDMQIEDNGLIRTFASGTFKIKEDITRRIT